MAFSGRNVFSVFKAEGEHFDTEALFTVRTLVFITITNKVNACDQWWGLFRRFYRSFHLTASAIVIVASFPRLETRMTADINVILQLLQRQIAPVPPAYSTVSSSSIPTDSSGLYGTRTPVLHSMYPISTIQRDSQVPTQVQVQNNPDIVSHCVGCYNFFLTFYLQNENLFDFFTIELYQHWPSIHQEVPGVTVERYPCDCGFRWHHVHDCYPRNWDPYRAGTAAAPAIGQILPHGEPQAVRQSPLPVSAWKPGHHLGAGWDSETPLRPCAACYLRTVRKRGSLR